MPLPQPSGQGQCHVGNSRLPRVFVDKLPSGLLPIPFVPPIVRRVILHVREYFRTQLNSFGILREYVHRRPSYDPDAHVAPEDLANFRTAACHAQMGEIQAQTANPPPPWPFDNMSVFLLMNWYHTGSYQKSEAEVTRLAKEVISAPDFRPQDLARFSAHQENNKLDNAVAAATTTPFSTDDWHEVSVEIEVPIPVRNISPQVFHVPGLHYRSIIQVIKATWEAGTQFHLTPFRKIHVDSMGKETRIFDEVYTSEAWEVAHDELQRQKSEPGCNLEKVIAGLMFWSDSTRLAQFGTASVWPLYMYFANLSKYTRAKPNSGACHHMAYIPSVSAYPILPDMLLMSCFRFLIVFMTSFHQFFKGLAIKKLF